MKLKSVWNDFNKLHFIVDNVIRNLNPIVYDKVSYRILKVCQKFFPFLWLINLKLNERFNNQ